MMDMWQARGGGQFCVVFDDCPVMLSPFEFGSYECWQQLQIWKSMPSDTDGCIDICDGALCRPSLELADVLSLIHI